MTSEAKRCFNKVKKEFNKFNAIYIYELPKLESYKASCKLLKSNFKGNSSNLYVEAKLLWLWKELINISLLINLSIMFETVQDSMRGES